MNSNAVSHLIYRAAGEPEIAHEGVAGVCRACGAEGVGTPFGRWVRPTFNDHDKMLPGEIVCAACLFCFDEVSPLLTRMTGRDKMQRMRNYSHFVMDGRWIPLTKGEKRRMVELLRQEPEAAVIAVSGQKHIIFRARPGWWQIEEHGTLPFPDVLWPLMETVEALYNGGFGKGEIETGRYASHRMMKFGAGAFIELEARLRPHRGTLPLEFALFLAQKDETDDEGLRGLPGAVPGGAESADPAVEGNPGGLQAEVRAEHLAAVRGQHPLGGLHGKPEQVRQLDLFAVADRDGGR